MTLKEKLDALIANTEKKAPPQALEVMHRATAALNNSDILDGIAVSLYR